MTTSLDATALADLLDDLMAWLKANPGKDLDDFAEDRGCSVEDISDSWNTYFSADFSRDYNLDTDQGHGGYHPAPPPHGDPQALKSYIVQEVNTYQEFTTINNIEDNSFNQQIIAGGDVNQDIDIDNSDRTVDDGGVLIEDSNVEDSNIVTGDRNVVDSEDAITGDVSTTVEDGGQGATNIGFGDGDIVNKQQNAEVDVTNVGDNTSGNTGSADGEGGDIDADADATGGTGGSGGDLDDPFLGVGGDGGNANADSTIDADSGDGFGGNSGNSGKAGNDTDVTVDFG